MILFLFSVASRQHHGHTDAYHVESKQGKTVGNNKTTHVADSLQNYLDVLSHLTGCLLDLRGKLFRGSGLHHETFQEDESDQDSDEDNSSNALGGKIQFLFALNLTRNLQNSYNSML